MEIPEIGGFLTYFESVRGRTRRAVAAIPPDRLEWAPREGGWTFGDLVRHIGATERWMFTENAAGRPSRYPGHGRDLAEGWDDVVAYLDRMHAESVEVLRALTPEDLRKPAVTPAGAALPAWKWLRAMVEHEIHHRGQIHLLLSLIGAPNPPMYGLTEEEVRAHSLPLEG